MSDDDLRVESDGAGCTLVTLNRPEAMNALSVALRRRLAATFDRLAGDAGTGVVILTGAGRAFCAGLDLRELGAGDPVAALDGDPAGDPVMALGRFPKPVIAAVNGPAVTGGFELALACDILLGSTAARFADTHARVGVMPGWGLSQKLSRVIGVHRAKELSFSGNFITAETAAAWGLLNRVVAPEDLLPAARRLAADILSALPAVVAAYKRTIDQGYAQTLADGLALESARARAANRDVAAAAIADRREAVRRRGREQG